MILGKLYILEYKKLFVYISIFIFFLLIPITVFSENKLDLENASVLDYNSSTEFFAPEVGVAQLPNPFPYRKNLHRYDLTGEYSLPVVTAANKISDWILQNQENYYERWVYDILFRLEVLQQDLMKKFEYRTIELTQDLVREAIIEQESYDSENMNLENNLDLLIGFGSENWEKHKEAKFKNIWWEQSISASTNVWTIIINQEKIEKTRLWWVNKLRSDRNLPIYLYSQLLENTAYVRSQDLADKEKADHKRFISSSYYDYKGIEKWFRDKGVWFLNRNWSTYTENIWRASYDCDLEDCTVVAIASMKKIFDYFATEESYNGVHWRTMIQPNFTHVWVWFTLSDDGKKLYGVMHYGVDPFEI